MSSRRRAWYVGEKVLFPEKKKTNCTYKKKSCRRVQQSTRGHVLFDVTNVYIYIYNDGIRIFKFILRVYTERIDELRGRFIEEKKPAIFELT